MKRCMLALAATLFAAPMASAQTFSDVVRLELLPGWRMADGTHRAGLRITLDPGWKTYWRAPGDAGIPPGFDWSESTNLVAAETFWPAPDVFTINGLRSIGYADVVVLPLALRPAEPDRDIMLDGQVELGVCETVCVPVRARVSARLPADEKRPDPAIRAALADGPESGEGAGVSRVDCEVRPISDGMRLTASIQMPSLGRGETAVVEAADPTIWVSAADATRHGATLTAVVDMVPPGGKPFALDRSTLKFTILADGRAVEFTGCDAG